MRDNLSYLNRYNNVDFPFKENTVLDGESDILRLIKAKPVFTTVNATFVIKVSPLILIRLFRVAIFATRNY